MQFINAAKNVAINNYLNVTHSTVGEPTANYTIIFLNIFFN